MKKRSTFCTLNEAQLPGEKQPSSKLSPFKLSHKRLRLIKSQYVSLQGTHKVLWYCPEKLVSRERSLPPPNSSQGILSLVPLHILQSRRQAGSLRSSGAAVSGRSGSSLLLRAVLKLPPIPFRRAQRTAKRGPVAACQAEAVHTLRCSRGRHKFTA